LVGWLLQRGRKGLRRDDRGGEDIKKVIPSPLLLHPLLEATGFGRFAESIVVSRAERFGTVSSDQAKLKMRALRFGIPDKDKVWCSPEIFYYYSQY